MVLFKNAYHFKFPAINIYFSRSVHRSCQLCDQVCCVVDDGRRVLVDADWKKPDQILTELAAIVGKTE